MTSEGSAATLQKCPVCDGTGLVSRPPGVAGDQMTWTSTGVGPYPCRSCRGQGTRLVLAEKTTSKGVATTAT